MITLELTEGEARHLKAALETTLVDLRREIARTEHREFREILRQREEALCRVVASLPAPAAA